MFSNIVMLGAIEKAIVLAWVMMVQIFQVARFSCDIFELVHPSDVGNGGKIAHVRLLRVGHAVRPQ
jgi:hypothetical protein